MKPVNVTAQPVRGWAFHLAQIGILGLGVIATVGLFIVVGLALAHDPAGLIVSHVTPTPAFP